MHRVFISDNESVESVEEHGVQQESLSQLNSEYFDLNSIETTDTQQKTYPFDLKQKHSMWAASHSLRYAASNLLHLLRDEGHDLPIDSRTLLKTPREAHTKTCGGQFWKERLPLEKRNQKLRCVNVERVPLFKSNLKQIKF